MAQVLELVQSSQLVLSIGQFRIRIPSGICLVGGILSMPKQSREALTKLHGSQFPCSRNTFQRTRHFQKVYCLWPSAKDQGITRVVVVVVLFHLSHSPFKRNLSEKNSSCPGIERGPKEPYPSTLPTELQQHCYT